MECEKKELERDRKNKWMEVLQRERISESRKENERVEEGKKSEIRVEEGKQ